MSDNYDQAVVDGNDGQGQPAPEGSDALGLDATLDSLVSEFETAPITEPAQPAASDSSEIVELRKLIETERNERMVSRRDQDIDQAIKSVVGEGDDALPLDEDIVTDAIWGRASRDDRFLKAFENRASNPAAWGKVLSAYRADLASKFKVDHNITGDVEAANNAVRSASTSPPADEGLDASTVNNMSDADFRRLTDGL